MIKVRNLSRRYGKFTAVANVSFTIGRNEIVGLLGHNGAGKTTVMKMLSGYLEPSAGDIEIAGINLANHPHAIQKQLGYLPENLPIYPEMMVADYLEYAATTKRIAPKDRLQAVKDALLATQLLDRALHSIDSLSRGMRQRLGVAQAILGRPELLILDEPTNGLDPEQTVLMRKLIKQLARRATVILSTHILPEIEAVCDRVLVLSNGKLVLDETMNDLCCTHTLLLRVCDGNPALPTYLRRLPQVSKVTPHPHKAREQAFTLNLHSGADADTAANNIAQSVVKAGARLYQLQPIVRDLESIFREASSGKASANVS